jgi:TonB family protein
MRESPTIGLAIGLTIGLLMCLAGCATPNRPPPAQQDAGRGPAPPVVRVCVDSTGTLVGEPEIALTSGKPQLDAAALQIAKKGRYSAGEGNDGPNCFKYRMQFEFREH